MRPIPTSHRSGRPPDYTQRSVKLRLFVFVAAVMLVLAVIERARETQTWQWLGALQRPEAAAEPFDNRLADHGLRTAADPAGAFVAVVDQKADASAGSVGEKNAVERARKQGWSDVLSRLPPEEQSLLFELLHAATMQRLLSPDKTARAGDLIETTERLWSDYQAAAFQSVADLTGDDQARWIDVLRQANIRFSDAVKPALQAVAAGRTLTAAELTAAGNLQQMLAELALGQVQDDTVIFRPAEREIWFYELGRLQAEDEKQLEKSSLGRVAYLQLAKQPADYRGKVVTVSGTVRLAYRVAAPPNYLGIKDYCVYWIHPAGGPDSPLVVYALGAPAGFPPLAAQNGDSGKASGKLREDVTVTGVFLKRCAYAARGGTYTAPLLIANVPQWHPAATSQPARAPFTPFQLLAMTVAAFLMAVCITAVIWKRTRHSHQAKLRRQSGGLVSVGNLAIGPSAEESIRELERQARGEANG